MKKLVLTLLGSLMATAVLHAQEIVTVTGTVTNSETGKPIEWVSVHDKNRVYDFVNTDKNGNYKIQIPLGTDVLFVRHRYRGKSYTVDSSHFNVALKPIPKEVQEEMDRKAREEAKAEALK